MRFKYYMKGKNNEGFNLKKKFSMFKRYQNNPHYSYLFLILIPFNEKLYFMCLKKKLNKRSVF